MNDKRTNLEIIAPNVDEAIQKGLADLGLPREAVDIEILDEGGKGLLLNLLRMEKQTRLNLHQRLTQLKQMRRPSEKMKKNRLSLEMTTFWISPGMWSASCSKK